jgi:two-component system NarL family sensor kinase
MTEAGTHGDVPELGHVATTFASSAAAIRLDPKGRISEATPSAAAMLGFEPQELRGRSLKDLALDGWQAAADVATARVRFGATESFELALKGRSGRRTLVEMTARAPGSDGAGALIAWSERRVRRGPAQADVEADAQGVVYGLMRSHEAERMRVAIELHDEIAPVVVMAKYMIEDAISRIGPDISPDSTRTLNDAVQQLRVVITELRRISTDLRPRQLDDLGLLSTLEWLCRGVEQSGRGLRVECRLSVAETDLPARLKLDIFRIVQDALANVIQHAGAARVVVSLYATGDELCVTVEDDGAPRREGPGEMGWQSIRKRIEATGGRPLLEAPGPRGVLIGGAWRLPALVQRER